MAFRMLPHDDRDRVRQVSQVPPPMGRRRRAARRTLAVLPTLLTLGNCLCGFLAVFFASRIQPSDRMAWHWSPLTIGAAFIFLGMIFDALDGRVARLTRYTSDLGEQLDSMADMVTFGVAPAYLVAQLVIRGATPYFASDNMDDYFGRAALVVACIYVACAALRLARFNIEVESDDVKDHLHFEGLPSPGAAGTVAALVLLHEKQWDNPTHQQWPVNAIGIGMVVIMLMVALAMVSRLRYVHLTNRYLRERAPIQYIAMLVIGVLLVLIHLQGALAAAFVAYAVSAPIVWLWFKMRPRKPLAA